MYWLVGQKGQLKSVRHLFLYFQFFSVLRVFFDVLDFYRPFGRVSSTGRVGLAIFSPSPGGGVGMKKRGFDGETSAPAESC